MDCKTAQSLVIPYINGQLSDEETEDFLDHIENCKECYEELEIHFTIHYALQKLDEDDKVSFNIPKMLKENLRDTKNRIRRRKIFRGVTACVTAVAEFLLLLTVMTQLEMFPEKSIGETGLYQFFHPGAGEETETETAAETGTEALVPDPRLTVPPDLWQASGHENWDPADMRGRTSKNKTEVSHE